MKSAIALRPELGGRVFECPEGIKFVETDVESGLLSTLSCPHRELVAITDRLAPNFECYNHRNLPSEWQDFGEPAPNADAANVLAQHIRINSSKVNSYSSQPTRVEIDLNGRRTLTNSMR